MTMSEKPRLRSDGSSPSHFYDVSEFHRKFGLPDYFTNGEPPKLIEDLNLQEFRINFMEEELREYQEAVAAGDLPKAADALVDLVYVVLGTAHFHNLPWQSLWDAVQRANMAKERCEIGHSFVPPQGGLSAPDKACYHLDEDGYCGASREKHSLRGNVNDVIKPKGWQPPDMDAVLQKFGWRDPSKKLCETCNGTGRINALTADIDCEACQATGYVRNA
jgi:predicted HAD superfamily Cof-like phosphohydrolase